MGARSLLTLSICVAILFPGIVFGIVAMVQYCSR